MKAIVQGQHTAGTGLSCREIRKFRHRGNGGNDFRRGVNRLLGGDIQSEISKSKIVFCMPVSMSDLVAAAQIDCVSAASCRSENVFSGERCRC